MINLFRKKEKSFLELIPETFLEELEKIGNEFKKLQKKRNHYTQKRAHEIRLVQEIFLKNKKFLEGIESKNFELTFEVICSYKDWKELLNNHFDEDSLKIYVELKKVFINLHNTIQFLFNQIEDVEEKKNPLKKVKQFKTFFGNNLLVNIYELSDNFNKIIKKFQFFENNKLNEGKKEKIIKNFSKGIKPSLPNLETYKNNIYDLFVLYENTEKIKPQLEEFFRIVKEELLSINLNKEKKIQNRIRFVFKIIQKYLMPYLKLHHIISIGNSAPQILSKYGYNPFIGLFQLVIISCFGLQILMNIPQKLNFNNS